MKKISFLLMAFGLMAVSCTTSDFENVYGEDPHADFAEQFTQTFGQIAPNQDWGFGTAMRSVNVNGNLWEEIPEVTEEEQNLVFNYVNYTRPGMKEVGHKYAETLPEDLVTYWVTQVWTGEDTYSTFDGTSTGILGSSHMNNLQIAEDVNAAIENGELVGNWFHVNNFNAGDNANYGGNTLIENSGCADFAYHNSEDSQYHNKWIAVDGADIDPSLAGYYYICFDFEATNPEAYTNFRFKVPGNNPGEWIEKTAQVPGAWTVESATAAGLEISYTEYVWDGTQNVEVTNVVTVGGEGTTSWSIDNVVGGNMCIPADDVYTDWIVRITKATPAEEETDEPVEGVLRIIAEDLGGATSDFDYNDVVFDAYIDADGYAHITLQAAGGTLPLYVAGEEVHEKFGVSTTTMVNTNAANGASKPAVSYTSASTYASVKDIPVVVYRADGTQLTLKAETGKAAEKIAVGTDYEWTDEREPVYEKYPLFNDYVNNPGTQWYQK